MIETLHKILQNPGKTKKMRGGQNGWSEEDVSKLKSFVAEDLRQIRNVDDIFFFIHSIERVETGYELLGNESEYNSYIQSLNIDAMGDLISREDARDKLFLTLEPVKIDNSIQFNSKWIEKTEMPIHVFSKMNFGNSKKKQFRTNLKNNFSLAQTVKNVSLKRKRSSSSPSFSKKRKRSLSSKSVKRNNTISIRKKTTLSRRNTIRKKIIL